MAILAQYANRFEVEIIDVYANGSRSKRALVKALAGEPFTVNTHGGPMNVDSALVSVDLLANVRQEPKPQPERPRRKSILCGDPRPEPIYTPFVDESFFSPRRARGGINND